MWKEMETIVLNSSQDLDGKIKIPSPLHDILAKLDPVEVSRMMSFSKNNYYALT